MGRASTIIGYDRIDFSGRDYIRQMFARQIAWAENHPARNTVQFDKSKPRSQLIARRYENRAPPQIIAAAAKTGAPPQIA